MCSSAAIQYEQLLASATRIPGSAVARPTTRLEPRKRAQQTRSRATRRRILDAAARVFERHGYAAGTTNRIAQAAGLSIGSVYQYYPNKDAILVELMRRHVSAGMSVIQSRLDDAGGLPGSLEGKVRLFVDAAIANHADDRQLHRVLFEEAPRPATLLAELHALEASTVTAVRQLLSADPSVGCDDLDLAAYLVVAGIESLTHRFIAGSSSAASDDRFAEELTRLFVAYLQGGRGRRRRRATE